MTARAGQAPRRRKWWVKMLTQWELYLMLLPMLAYIFVFNYMPMYGVQIAFRDYRTSKGIWGSEWVGLKHFIDFLNYPNCWPIVRSTLMISLYSFATFPLSILFALMLHELQSKRLRKVAQMVSYAPYFISVVVACSILTLFLNRGNGLINNVIALAGGERTAFLEHPEFFPSIYVWSDVWQGIGWSTIIYLGALANVSPELEEASIIDGATRLQIIRHVHLPSILPTIVITLILRCGGLLGVGFEKAFLLQNPLNLSASEVISTYVYRIGLQSGRFSYSAAIGLFNTVINVVILLGVNQIAKRTSEISLW